MSAEAAGGSRTGSRLVAAAVLLVCAACGGRDAFPPTAQGTPGAAASATASAPTSSSGSGTEPLADTDLGVLPTPIDLPSLQRRAIRLPNVLAGSQRAPGPTEDIRYVGAAGEFGIDVSEIGDLGPGISTVTQALDAIGADLAEPRTCARPPSACVRGTSEGALVVVWGHDRATLVYAALAPDEATLQALLTAWAK